MTGVHYLPPWANQPPNLCPDCRRQPRAGERHGLVDGLTEDGEPLGITCLDADGKMLHRPDSYPSLPAESRYPDPWSAPSDEPPPF